MDVPSFSDVQRRPRYLPFIAGYEVDAPPVDPIVHGGCTTTRSTSNLFDASVSSAMTASLEPVNVSSFEQIIRKKQEDAGIYEDPKRLASNR